MNSTTRSQNLRSQPSQPKADKKSVPAPSSYPNTPLRLTPTRFGRILMCLETAHHLSTSVPMSAAVPATLRSILANPVGVDGLIIVGMGP